MALEVGSIVEGVITGITNFGAFVKLPDGNTGLIHISEVADVYVQDIRVFISEKDTVMVKVLGVNDKGKFDLSLKQAKQSDSTETGGNAEEKSTPPAGNPGQTGDFRQFRQKPGKSADKRDNFGPVKLTFEDKLSKFLKESEERLLDIKRSKEAKRGKGKGR